MLLRSCLRLLPLSCAMLIPAPAPAQSSFVRGDHNLDGEVDVSDAVGVLFVLFAGLPSPGCESAGDANDDGALGLTDATVLLEFLFRGGTAPPAPFPACGLDATADDLTCTTSPDCGSDTDSDPTIREWTVPWPGTRPRDPYVDDLGRVWFVGQNGDYAAYLEPASGEFERFDLADRAGPHNVIVDEFAWYTGNLSAHIGRIDRRSGEIRVIPMPDAAARDPHTLVFDREGNLWFTVQLGNFVGRLDRETLEVKLTKVQTAGSRPYGIVMDPGDTPWFVEFGSNRIGVIDKPTLKVTEHVIPASNARPRRIGITSDGVVWYTDYPRGRLGRFDPAGNAFSEKLLPGGAGSRPYGMAVDDRDRVWVVETGAQPNRFVGYNPRTDTFFSNQAVPSGGGTVRHMHFHPSTRTIWFGTDAGTIGQARL